jgi:hypothetical protein
VSAQDQGLSLWKLLDHAASDDESSSWTGCAACCTINFFRQAADGGPDLYLNVHDRLLSAVSSNTAMPSAASSMRWNYRWPAWCCNCRPPHRNRAGCSTMWPTITAATASA